jgi:hypothetical protein
VGQPAHVDVAGAQGLVLHVRPDAGDLVLVGLEFDLGEDFAHRPALGQPVLHQRIEARST